jgi:hypothetical protein
MFVVFAGLVIGNAEDLIDFFNIYQQFLYFALIMTALFWGKHHLDSKCLMMQEVFPRLKILSLFGEALAFFTHAMIWMIPGWLMLLYFIHHLDLPELKREVESLMVSEENGQVIVGRSPHSSDLGEGDQFGLKLAFVEGESLSPLTFIKLPESDIYQGSMGEEDLENGVLQDEAPENEVRQEQVLVLKNMREIFLKPEKLSLRKYHRQGDQFIELRVTQARWLKMGDYWTLSFWRATLEFLCLSGLLSLVLALLGKHVSLELGLVVLLTFLFVRFSMSLYDDGDLDRIFMKMASTDRLSQGFQVHWWQMLLSKWSLLLQETVLFKASSEGVLENVLLSGYEWRPRVTWGARLFQILLCGIFCTFFDRLLAKMRSH